MIPDGSDWDVVWHYKADPLVDDPDNEKKIKDDWIHVCATKEMMWQQEWGIQKEKSSMDGPTRTQLQERCLLAATTNGHGTTIPI